METDSPLLEILSAVGKRRRTLVWFLAAVLASSLVLNFFVLPKEYAGTCIILPMATPQAPIAVTVDAIKSEILDPSFAALVVQSLNGRLEAIEYLGGLGVTTQASTGLVWVSYRGRDRGTIEQVLLQVVPVLNVTHEKQYQAAIKGYQEALAALDMKIAEISGQEKAAAKLLQAGQSRISTDGGLEYALLSSYYGSLLNQESQFISQRSGMVVSLGAAHTFQYVTLPEVPLPPVGPRKVFNTVVSLAVAVVLGIAWAFLSEKRHPNVDR
jgi:capsular polysaccharide biosynthesis protein